jgi:hypothetical protein
MTLDPLLVINTWGGDAINNSDFLMNAGGGEVEVVAGPTGAPSIVRAERGGDYHGFDLITTEFDWDIENHDYLIIYRGHIPGGGQARISQADSPHGVLSSMPTSGDFELRYVITNADITGGRRHVRITADANSSELQIHEVIVQRAGAGNTGIISGFAPTDGTDTSRLDLIIGRGLHTWPLATSNMQGGRAFVPVAGSTIRITYDVESVGAAGWRVRWSRDESFGLHPQADTDTVNDHRVWPGDIATYVPAVWQVEEDGVQLYADGRHTLVVEITLDGSQDIDGLIGNIVLRGMWGSHDWFAYSMIVELLDGPGGNVVETLVNWVAD